MPFSPNNKNKTTLQKNEGKPKVKLLVSNYLKSALQIQQIYCR